MNPNKKSLQLPIGSFTVTMNDRYWTVVTVEVKSPLHFTVHHYPENGMEYVVCNELKSLTTENFPEYDRRYTWCNIYREIVYKLWESDVALGKRGARNQLRLLKQYCKIIKENQYEWSRK